MADETYVRNQLYMISLNELQPDPNQPRKTLDPQGLEELTGSIARNNVLVPISFRVENVLKYIVTGERRCASARMAGLTTIPAIYVDSPNYAEIALIDNLVRQDLTAVEEAEALQNLMKGKKYTQEQLGAVIGKAQSTIAEILTLNRLPQEIRDECRGDRTISKNTLIEIAKKTQTRSMLKAYDAYKEKVKKLTEPQQKEAKKADVVQPILDLFIKATDRLRNLATAEWTPEERAGLQVVLVELKSVLENFLAAPEPSAPEPKTKKKKKLL
jgi:ParB family transcriptional regulator, chromosome partitioning protein